MPQLAADRFLRRQERGDPHGFHQGICDITSTGDGSLRDTFLLSRLRRLPSSCGHSVETRRGTAHLYRFARMQLLVWFRCYYRKMEAVCIIKTIAKKYMTTPKALQQCLEHPTEGIVSCLLLLNVGPLLNYATALLLITIARMQQWGSITFLQGEEGSSRLYFLRQDAL